MLSQPTATQSKTHEEFQGVFGKKCCWECLFFPCTMKSSPCPSTPEVGLGRHGKHCTSFLQHFQLQLLAPRRGHACDSAWLTLRSVCWYPTEVGPGISFCRMSALLVFPHERMQMFPKASLHGLMLREKGWSWSGGSCRGGSCQGQPGEHSPATKTWAVLWEADFTSVSVESEDKMFSCVFKVSSSKCHHDKTLLDHLFPWSVTNMFHVVCDADTWMWERRVQRTKKCHVTLRRDRWATMKSKEL